MFHSRTFNNKVNHLYEKTLRIVYRNYDCSYKDLLKMDHSFTAHQRNIQSLIIELFKVKQNTSTQMINNVFQIRDNLKITHRVSQKLC